MEIKFDIGGMTCGGCVRSVTRVIEGLPGVERAAVDLSTASARVEGPAIDPSAIIAAVEDAGFDARVAG